MTLRWKSAPLARFDTGRVGEVHVIGRRSPIGDGLFHRAGDGRHAVYCTCGHVAIGDNAAQADAEHDRHVFAMIARASRA